MAAARARHCHSPPSVSRARTRTRRRGERAAAVLKIGGACRGGQKYPVRSGPDLRVQTQIPLSGRVESNLAIALPGDRARPKWPAVRREQGLVRCLIFI